MGAPPFALDRDKVRDNPCAKHTLKDYIIIEELFASQIRARYTKSAGATRRFSC